MMIPNPVRRTLQPMVGWVVLRRWPWPLWKLRGWGMLPVGPESFRFENIARPEYAWWAHEARRGRWERAVIGRVTAALRPGDVFFDVGAYLGPFTLLAAHIVGPQGRVIAFEPDPVPRAVLERNVAINGASNVEVVPFAVGDHDGSVRFSASGDSVAHVVPAGGIEVRQVTLDGFCAEREITPTVIKVDIEGGEALALRDSTVVQGLRELFVEIHEPALRAQGIDPVALLDALGSHELLESPVLGNYEALVRPGGKPVSAG
jgi:FkbM family methyltransferase